MQIVINNLTTQKSSNHVEYLVNLMKQEPNNELVVENLNILKRSILTVSSKNSGSLALVFQKLYRMLANEELKTEKIKELLLLNLYNTLVVSRQLQSSVDVAAYAQQDPELFAKFVANLSEICAQNTQHQFALTKLNAILVLCEVGKYKTAEVEQLFESHQVVEMILETTQMSLTYQTQKKPIVQAVEADKDELVKLSKMLVKNSLVFMNTLRNDLLQTNFEIFLDIVQKCVQLKVPQWDHVLLDLLHRMYQNSTTQEYKSKLINDKSVMQYCERLLYTCDEKHKLNLVIKFLNVIVYNNNASELQRLVELDLSQILIQILTETLINDVHGNVTLKFNVLGILGRMVLVDQHVFMMLVDDNRVLFDLILHDYFSGTGVRFQQCVTFFLNNVLLAAKQNGCEKFFSLVFVDYLSTILEKCHAILEHNAIMKRTDPDNYDATLCNAVNLSILEIFSTLVEVGTRFDKLQCLKYPVFHTAFTIARDFGGETSYQYYRLSLKIMSCLMNEYVWAARKNSQNFKIPSFFEFFTALNESSMFPKNVDILHQFLRRLDPVKFEELVNEEFNERVMQLRKCSDTVQLFAVLKMINLLMKRDKESHKWDYWCANKSALVQLINGLSSRPSMANNQVLKDLCYESLLVLY